MNVLPLSVKLTRGENAEAGDALQHSGKGKKGLTQNVECWMRDGDWTCSRGGI